MFVQRTIGFLKVCWKEMIGRKWRYIEDGAHAIPSNKDEPLMTMGGGLHIFDHYWSIVRSGRWSFGNRYNILHSPLGPPDSFYGSKQCGPCCALRYVHFHRGPDLNASTLDLTVLPISPENADMELDSFLRIVQCNIPYRHQCSKYQK